MEPKWDQKSSKKREKWRSPKIMQKMWKMIFYVLNVKKRCKTIGFSMFSRFRLFMKMFENSCKNDQKIDEKSMKIRCQKDVKIMPAKILPKMTKKWRQGAKMWSQGWPKASKMRPWSVQNSSRIRTWPPLSAKTWPRSQILTKNGIFFYKNHQKYDPKLIEKITKIFRKAMHL